MAIIDIEVDASGLLCPLPILRLARALRNRPAGAVALLRATDPAAVADVEVFCKDQTHRLLESRREGDLFVFVVEKGR